MAAAGRVAIMFTGVAVRAERGCWVRRTGRGGVRGVVGQGAWHALYKYRWASLIGGHVSINACFVMVCGIINFNLLLFNQMPLNTVRAPECK